MNTLSTQAAGAAQAANNLSDLASAPAARGNLGAGTVNSVALSMPSEFSVSGSPVTSSGTLAVSRTTQGANLVEAGPASGSAAVPTFRALTAADLPPLGDSMAFQTGRFYVANGIISGPASASIAAGSLTAGTPIFIPNAITLQTMSCETSGAVTGTAHARMAFYTDAGGKPGVPVTGADSGDLTQTTAGVLTSGALGVALAPGWYWPVFETSGLAGATLYAANSARPSMNAQTGADTAANAIQNPYHVLFMTHTYGTALPNPWVSTSEGVATFMPVIALGF
jgi:hypothetical protein